MISNLVELVGLGLFWTLLLSVVGFAGLAGWCVLVELTEAAYRRRARRGEPVPLPYARRGRG